MGLFSREYKRLLFKMGGDLFIGVDLRERNVEETGMRFRGARGV